MKVAEVNAKSLIRDAPQKKNFPSGLMAEKHFVRKANALLNDGEEGIAYLVMGNMGNNARQREIREAMGELAEEVANQIGLPRPPAHLECRGVTRYDAKRIEGRHGQGCGCAGTERCSQLRVLAALFASSPARSVATTMTRLGRAKGGLTPEPGQWTIGDLLKGVGPLQEFLKEYGKPAFTKDLQKVTAFLQGLPVLGSRNSSMRRLQH